jgi:choline dehydrogenase-like flavoprotein
LAFDVPGPVVQPESEGELAEFRQTRSRVRAEFPKREFLSDTRMGTGDTAAVVDDYGIGFELRNFVVLGGSNIPGSSG